VFDGMLAVNVVGWVLPNLREKLEGLRSRGNIGQCMTGLSGSWHHRVRVRVIELIYEQGSSCVHFGSWLPRIVGVGVTAPVDKELVSSRSLPDVADSANVE